MKKYNKLLFSTLGAAFEYYDLAIYSVFAVTLGSKFFDKTNSVSNTLLVFLVYIVGYIVRPLGAWIFGYIADKRGRAFVLKLNMVILFFSTLALSFLPTVESIGVIATVLFVSLRCIQSLAVGAEIPVSVVYIVENYPKRQGLVTSLVFLCLSTGIMMTSLVFFILDHYSSKTFINEYGWRVGFFVGACFTFILFFLRRGIVDAPVKFETKDTGLKLQRLSFTFKLIVGVALVACIATLTNQLYLFLPSFSQLYLANDFDVSSLLLVGSIITAISCVVGGFISDYVSREKMMVVLILLTIVLVPGFYKNLLEGKDALGYFVLISIIYGFFASTYNVIITNFFRAEYRCRGYGLAYNLGYLLFSAGGPAFTIILINKTGDIFMPVYLIIFAGCISLVGIVASSSRAMRRV